MWIQGSNNKTLAYQETLTKAMDAFFPWKTTRRKSNDLPWLSKKVLKEIAEHKRFFWEEGGKRTAAWKERKKRTDDLIKKRKRGYMDTQKKHILAEDANRNFFRHVKTFSRHEKPKAFDVRQLFKNKTYKEISEELASYFVKVLREFEPLEPEQVPFTTDVALPVLQNFQGGSEDQEIQKACLWCQEMFSLPW